MIKKTEWFDYVSDKDMQVLEIYNSMIMYSYEKKIFAMQKACGDRPVFPLSNVYHPTDGNCVILTGNRRYNGYIRDLVRINTIVQLNACVDHANST